MNSSTGRSSCGRAPRHVPVREQPGEDAAARRLLDQEAGDVVAARELARLADASRPRARHERPVDDVALGPLDPRDLGRLGRDRQAPVHEAEPALERHRHRHRRVGDAVHVGGDDGQLEGQPPGQRASGARPRAARRAGSPAAGTGSRRTSGRRTRARASGPWAASVLGMPAPGGRRPRPPAPRERPLGYHATRAGPRSTAAPATGRRARGAPASRRRPRPSYHGGTAPARTRPAHPRSRRLR